MRIDLRRAGRTRSASMCTCHGGNAGAHVPDGADPLVVCRQAPLASNTLSVITCAVSTRCSRHCANWSKHKIVLSVVHHCATPHTMEHVSAHADKTQAVAVLLLWLGRPLGGARGQTQMRDDPCRARSQLTCDRCLLGAPHGKKNLVKRRTVERNTAPTFGPCAVQRPKKNVAIR